MVGEKWLCQVWGSGFPCFLPHRSWGDLIHKDRGASPKLTTNLGLDFRPNTLSPNYRYRRVSTHPNGLGGNPLLSDKFQQTFHDFFAGGFLGSKFAYRHKMAAKRMGCYFLPWKGRSLICGSKKIFNCDSILLLHQKQWYIPGPSSLGAKWFLVYRPFIKSFVWLVRAYYDTLDQMYLVCTHCHNMFCISSFNSYPHDFYVSGYQIRRTIYRTILLKIYTSI